jgi:hypothetical protein
VNELINDLVTQQEKKSAVSRIKPKSSASLRRSITDLVNDANSLVPVERQVTLRSAFTVASRSLNASAGLDVRTRVFSAYKEVSSFIMSATSGHMTSKHSDLLPIGHPYSSRNHAMTAAAYADARARWIAADPRIDDSAREIVAAAYRYPYESVERAHAVTRLSSLTAGLVPREIVLTALTAAFSFGDGNSSAARSARAKLQWRDRMGRWIEMGRGIGFKIRIGSNSVPVNGKFIGVSGKQGLVQVKGDANLPDGIYPIESSNAQAYKALLPDSAVEGKTVGKLSSILDKKAQVPSQEELAALRMDAPAGWTKNEDGSFGSDDDYIVDEADGKLSLFRKDKNGDKGAQVGEQVDDWAQIQDLANADQKDYDNFKRIMSSPQNADVLPGSETDPYDKMPESTKAFLKELDDKKEKDLADAEERAKAYNEQVDKFEEMFDQGKDLEGRDIPEGWEVANVKYGSGDNALQIRSFQKIVPSKDGTGQVQVIAEIDDKGKIKFGHRADWFNKDEQGFEGYDTWEEAEARIPDVVNWVGDSKTLMHDPENPFYKDTIPVPSQDEEVIAELPEAEDVTPATPAAAEESLLDKLVTPDGSYKLQSPGDYEPEGRYDDELSPDYTDDPKVLANKFTEEELKQALSQAVIGTKDFADQFLEELDELGDDEEDEEAPKAKSKPGPKKKKPAKANVASGSGLLEFKAGEDFVPAEPIYNALKEQGFDVDKFVAELYDSQLGESKNVDMINGLRKEENVGPQEPSAIIDEVDLDPNIYIAHQQIAVPDIASVATMQMNDLIDQGESNEKIKQIAQEIKNMGGTQGYKKLLEDHIELAFSENPDDKTAFRSLWGLLMSTDGGVTDSFDRTDLTVSVESSMEKYFGAPPAPNQVSKFFDEYGYYDEFIQSKIDIAKSRASIMDPDSTAGAYFRLIASVSGPNTATLYRGISLKTGSDAAGNYTEEGRIISIDPRSFSDDKLTAGNFADAFKVVDGDAVIFTIPAGKGSSLNVTSVSMFTDEREHVAWGDYRIAKVKEKVLPTGGTLYNVELEQVTSRDRVLEGYSDNYEKFLLQNAEVELPEGYYSSSPEPYISNIENDGSLPEEFTDSPLYISRMWDTNDLIEVYRAGIEDGSGKVTLEYPIEGGYEASIDVEAVRDALQIQGIDTNEILNDVANAEPGTVAVEGEELVAEADVDNPIDQLAEDIATEYDMEGWKKTGPQLGSNEGGFYEDPDGNRYYVKTPKSDLHAQNEALASALYRALGIDAAEIYIGSADDGKKKTYSPDIPESKADLDEKLNDTEYISKLQEGFAVDAWLANWDVAGLVFDNVMSDGDGNPVRVDPGGALLFRAMGSPKGSLFGNEVSELDTLRDKNMNPQSAQLFGSMTDEQQKESARKLLDISHDEIGQLVDSVIEDPKAAQQLKDTLIARRQYILDRYDLLADDTSIIADNADVTADEAPTTPDTPESQLDVLYDWAIEYQDETYGTLPSDAKQFNEIANQVDAILVDYRNGDITDEQLPDVLDELSNFIDTYGWKGDEATRSNVEDLTDQLDAIKSKLAPEQPEVVQPVAVEAPEVPSDNVNNPYVTSDGVPIIPGMKMTYKKSGEVVNFIRYDKGNSSYVYVDIPSVGGKPKVISTKQLISISDGDGGGGGEGPKAPEAPDAPEPEALETPTPETPQEDIGQFDPTAQLTDDGKKVRVSFTQDGNRPFNPNSDTGPSGYEEVLPYVVDSKLDVDGVDEITVEIPLEKMDEFNKTYKSVFDESIVPDEFYGDIYSDWKNKELEPETSKISTETPFGDEALLNQAAEDLIKVFANGMPDGGEILAVNENDGMIAVTPDGEIVYIFDAKKKTSYTPEAKPDFFKPGGNGVEVFKWRQLTEEENTALTKKISDNAVPYGQVPEDKDAEGSDLDVIDAPEDTEQPQPGDLDIEPPAGAVTASDANGNVIWAGVEVVDKTGAAGTVTKVNKDGYATVQFPDGTTKWRSAKTLQATGDIKEGMFTPPSSTKKSKKATGAGVAPVVVEKPSDWGSSDFEGVPAVRDALSIVLNPDDKTAGMRGASAPVDSDSIEDLDVRFMHVYDENGADGVQVKLKLTNWAAKKRIKEILAMSPAELNAAGITIESMEIPKIVIDENGIGRTQAGVMQYQNKMGATYTIRTADGVVIKIHRANKDDSTKFMSSYSEKAAKAFHNLVTIQAPANATPETIANALGQAGVADVRPATAEDARILVENRLMSIFDAQTDANTNLKEKAREDSLARIADKWGITPDDVVITTGASGRIETRLSPEGAAKIWEATGKPAAIFHNVSMPWLEGNDDKKADWLVQLFTAPQGGLLSTTTRWTEGIGGAGMSSMSDVGTGGAEYVFTKPVANASAKVYGVTGPSPHILFDPLKVYQRLDFYANQQDAYGKRTKNKDVISAARVGAYEVMFKHRMDWADLDVVVMSPTMRSMVLGKLKAKGITQIGGRSIEEVFVIGEKQKEEE